jgi:hypothetical protein
MAKRFSFFGTTLPLWEAEKIGGGSTTLTFILEGRIISKKNNQMAVVSKKIAKDWLSKQQKSGKKLTYADVETALKMTQAKFIGNALYSDCRAEFLPKLEAQKKVWEERLGEKGLKFPLKKASMTLRFYFKDKYLTDTVNKQQTVQDLLVEAGIIANDDYKTINPIHAESGLYKDKIRENIVVVRLAFQLPKPKKQIKVTDELK